MMYRSFRHISFVMLVGLVSFWFSDFARAMEVPAAAAEPIYSFTGKDAASIVNEALLKQGVGATLKTRIYNIREDEVLVNASEPVEAEVDALDVDKAHTRWQATLILRAGSKNLAPVKMAGHYDETAQVPVLKRSLQASDIIGSEDIAWSEELVNHLRKSTVTDTKDLIGKSPRRMITQGRPIRLEEISSPSILAKGDHITLTFRTANLEIKTLGEALDGGAKGDVIRVRNLASKAIIQGIVESAGNVRVTSPDTVSAEAM